MSQLEILIAESRGFSSEAIERLRRLGRVVAADLDRRELHFAVQDADVLWVRLRNRIDGRVMDAAPRLRLIVTSTTGLNHIDTIEAERRRIGVLSLRDVASQLTDVRATAELTLALMLCILRNLPAANRCALRGPCDRLAFRGAEISGKTIGLVGYGRLGRMVARYLLAMHARVLVSERPGWQGALDDGVSLVAIEELLKRSDIVSLHANLSTESRGFFNAACFRAMKPGAWFVNTARGELVDEKALLEALESGRLAGAALDVLCDEQTTNLTRHPLVRYARRRGNLLLTPHIGGCTRESMERTELMLTARLEQMIASGLPASRCSTAGNAG